ncbi:MAG: hypothetical protein JWP44_1477 [Mucilaginibacter sp.]|nr:hypothetical protein [Mucilaginibacter sp.]
MIKKDYIAEKENKNKSTQNGILVLVIFILLFFIVIFRIAVRSDLSNTYFNEAPTGKDAFVIAKDYIRPTLDTKDVRFSDDFQYTKQPDSVFLMKSYFEEKGRNAEKVDTHFVITLKYKGGANLNDHSWAVISFQEQ